MSTDWTGFAGARAIGEEERLAIELVLSRRTLYRGAGLVAPSEVRAGERELAAALGRRFALLMNSGTSALLTALVAAGVAEGDEVVLPGYGWLTDLSIVLHLGAVPVFAPIKEDLMIDSNRISDCLSGRTRAVMPVHVCGRPYDVFGVEAAASAGSVEVIEDACQGLGASVRNVPAGGFGRVSGVSFQAFKLATGGEGGALLTDDDRIYGAAVRFHDGGLLRFASEGLASSSSAEHPEGVGLNLRMSEVTAALVRVQVRRLPSVVRRLRNARTALLAALQEALAARALRLVEPRHEAEESGAGVLLQAADARVARHFRDIWARHGCLARLASEARLHALPGWLEYLRRMGASHRVIDREATEAVLAGALIIEVNWQQTERSLDELRVATHEALATLG